MHASTAACRPRASKRSGRQSASASSGRRSTDGAGRAAPARSDQSGDLGALATKLGRPLSALSALEQLTEDEVALLSGAIDAAIERERRSIERALSAALPGGLALRVLRAGLR